MTLLSSTVKQNSHQSVFFTSSSTFTVPPSVYAITVTMCGGGGGAANVAGGGGSGGWVEKYPLAVIPGETLTITVGAGGARISPAASTWCRASKGGTTEVLRGSTPLLTAYGGGGGYAYYSSTSRSESSSGGDGGWPNGSGGGSDSAITVTRGGGCGTSKTHNSAGSGHGGAARPSQGSGLFQGVDRFGGRTFISGYGHGGDGLNNNTAADGVPGVVIIQFLI